MPRTSRLLVSVICLTYNRQKNVMELLSALQRQDYDLLEVILIDNNSVDQTADKVEELFPEVKVLRSPQNFGNVSYNLGFANAKGEYFVLLDDDGLPGSHDLISKVVDHLVSDAQLGALAFAIRMRDTGLLAEDSPRFFPENDDGIGFPAAAYNGTGAALRASTVRQVGFYPFHYFLSWSELHLCTRIIEAGWKVRFIPTLEVWHGRSSGSVDRPFTYYGLRNYLWYVWEFYPWPEVLFETVHYLSSRFKSVLKRKLSIGLLLKATIDGVGGGRKILSARRPVSRSTLEHLRQIRSYGNDNGLIQKYRSFPALMGNVSLDEPFLLRQAVD